MTRERNEFIMKGLEGLYCIQHRKNPNVFINDEGFITVSTCCDEFHEALYHAQDSLREEFNHSRVQPDATQLR